MWKKTTCIFTNVKFSNEYKSSFIAGIFVVICYPAFKNVFTNFSTKVIVCPIQELVMLQMEMQRNKLRLMKHERPTCLICLSLSLS